MRSSTPTRVRLFAALSVLLVSLFILSACSKSNDKTRSDISKDDSVDTSACASESDAANFSTPESIAIRNFLADKEPRVTGVESLPRAALQPSTQDNASYDVLIEICKPGGVGNSLKDIASKISVFLRGWDKAPTIRELRIRNISNADKDKRQGEVRLKEFQYYSPSKLSSDKALRAQWDYPGLVLDGNCNSIDLPWSILESSPSNSNLSAVLAGFMIAAIVYLLSGSPNGASKEKALPSNTKVTPAVAEQAVPTTHTLALFGSGVLVLGFASYLFGSIAATRPPAPNDIVTPGAEYICEMAWTQALPASGMLATGGSLMLAGLGWLLSQHAGSDMHNGKAYPALVLANLITMAAIMITSALLISTTITYLDQIVLTFGRDVPSTVRATAIYFGAVGAAISVFLIATRGLRFITYKRAVGHRWTADILEPRYKSLTAAAIATTLLAIVGPIFARFAELHTIPFTQTEIPVLFEIFVAIGTGLVLPVFISMMIAYGTPGPPCWFERSYWKERSVRMSEPKTSSVAPLHTTATGSALTTVLTVSAVVALTVGHIVRSNRTR